MGAAEFILLIAAMVGVAIMMPSMVGAQHTAFSDQVAQVEAGQLSTITNAALQYEYGYMASLSAPGSTHTVTVATLIQQGYLPPGTSAVDAMGDPISVEYQADSNGNVTGYVVAQGNYRYPDADAGQILLDLGDRGGYVPEVPVAGQVAGTIYGTGRTWQAPAPAGIGPGSIDVKVESNAAQQADDSRFLWRVPAPTAADNTMSTPLILGAVETPGAGCANTGAIAQDGTGALVSCQSGTWTAVGGGHWRAPVATYSALPGSGNQDGDVRLTLDTDRAFAWNGGSWVALAVNQNGNLHVPGTGYFGGDVDVSGELATNGYSPHAGLPPGWGGGIQTWDIDAHGTIGVGPNNSSPNASMNNAGTIENQGVCIDNNSGSCQSWGLNAHYTNGWDMVASDGGSLNANPQSALGSLDVNDIVVRSGGAYPWYSQLSSQVYSDTQQINSLNNEYSSQQGQINSNTSSIGAINNNLNQGPCSTGYNSIATLCNEFNSAMGSVANLGKPEYCSGPSFGQAAPSPQDCTQGPVTYSYWGWCGSRYYRYRCIQYGTSPPTVNLPTESYPQLVVAVATAGIGSDIQDGCGTGPANTGILTLSATSGGATLAQSAQYAKGGSNYNPTDMYFPFSITFVLPAGQGGQIQLSGGNNGLGCGSFMYSLDAL
ncbi:MAG: hypothetical protein ACP5P4_16450 [Steroidobacteraceae bacterium]